MKGTSNSIPNVSKDTIDEIISTLTGKAASSHTHATSDITGLDTALSGKAASSHTHSDYLSSVFYAGSSAPSNTKLLWIDTNSSTGGLKYYNGSSWKQVPVAYS